MNQTNLVRFLRVLTKPERRQARLWLESPLHNRRSDLVRLFLFINKFLNREQEIPGREVCFTAVFPGETFQDQQLRLSCSRLLKCLEDWLSWKQWQQQEAQKGQALLTALRELDLPQHFQRQRRRQQALLERSELRHHAFHLSKYQLEQEIYQWESHEGRGKPLNLQDQETALQTFFISNKLRDRKSVV